MNAIVSARPNYLFFSLIVLFLSCSTSHSESSESESEDQKKEDERIHLEVNYDNRVAPKSIINLDSALITYFQKDQDFIDFISSHYNEWVEFEDDMFNKLYVHCMIQENQARMKEALQSEDVTRSGPEVFKQLKGLRGLTKSVVGSVVGGIDLLQLERKREKLYGSYSSDKQDHALVLEIFVNSILYEVYYEPLNEELAEIKRGTNYRCPLELLEGEKDSRNWAKKLRQNMNDLEKSYRQLRPKIYLNKLLYDDRDYTNIQSYLVFSLESNTFQQFRCNANDFTQFIRKFLEVRKLIMEYDTHLDAPKEHWNIERVNALNMVILNINQKLLNFAQQLNQDPERYKWEPYAESIAMD